MKKIIYKFDHNKLCINIILGSREEVVTNDNPREEVVTNPKIK